MSIKELLNGAPMVAPFAISTIRADELMLKEIPPRRMIAPGFVVEGLNLWAGRPKSGKSWLLYHLAIAVASGKPFLGAIEPVQGDVLYLALEDNESRLQARLEQLLGDDTPPLRLHLSTHLPRLDEGGIQAIEEWLKEHPRASLVIIDTLARVKPRTKRNASMYEGDTDALAPLQKLAMAYKVAVVVVHHTRKAAADDVFDTLSGSLGLSGVADALGVLQRKRDSQEGTFSLTGRDVDEEVFTLIFDKDSGRWSLSGTAKGYFETLTPERKRILKVLSNGPMLPIEIARSIGHSDSNSVRKMLFKMRDAGQVERLEGGKYKPISVSSVTTSPKDVVTEESPSRTGIGDNVSTVVIDMSTKNPFIPETVVTHCEEIAQDDKNNVSTTVLIESNCGNEHPNDGKVEWHELD